MSNYYSILTNAGIQKEILSKQNGSSINLAKMAVGSGEITPTQTMTSLKSEKYRFNINSILQSETNPNHLIVEGVIPSDVGGFEISEIGIYLDDNTFYAVGNLPKTYKPLLEEGSAKDLTIKMFIEVSNSDSIVLKVDDSVVLATRNYVKNELKKYAFKNGDETKLFKVKDAVALNEAVNKKQVENYLKTICPTGTILLFAGTSVPSGFLECVGLNLDRTVYSNLFSVIGTTYGAGNGITTFNIPDFRDRFPRGRSTTRAVGKLEEDAIGVHNHWLPTGSGVPAGQPPAPTDLAYGFQDTVGQYGYVNSVWSIGYVNKGNSLSGQGNTTYPNNLFPYDYKITPDNVGSLGRFDIETRPKSMTLMFCIKY